MPTVSALEHVTGARDERLSLPAISPSTEKRALLDPDHDLCLV